MEEEEERGGSFARVQRTTSSTVNRISFRRRRGVTPCSRSGGSSTAARRLGGFMQSSFDQSDVCGVATGVRVPQNFCPRRSNCTCAVHLASARRSAREWRQSVEDLASCGCAPEDRGRFRASRPDIRCVYARGLRLQMECTQSARLIAATAPPSRVQHPTNRGTSTRR